ncbi:MAG: hypothetical protein NZM11_00795 [Anaerolineales bacterium]|nr:hypothetical protein [Anaerolineales bacterium]
MSIPIGKNGQRLVDDRNTLAIAIVHAYQQGQIADDGELARTIERALHSVAREELAACVALAQDTARAWREAGDERAANACEGVAIILLAREDIVRPQAPRCWGLKSPTAPLPACVWHSGGQGPLE